MLLRCDEVWVFDWTISEGMQSEIEWAKENEVRVRRITDIGQEVRMEQ